MPGGWQGSTRRDRLPPNWPTIRQEILERDGHRCTVVLRSGQRCTDKATEVDHIIRGDDHSPSNLAGICRWHHERKSSAEGNAGRTRYSNRRPAEAHPGLTG